MAKRSRKHRSPTESEITEVRLPVREIVDAAEEERGGLTDLSLFCSTKPQRPPIISNVLERDNIKRYDYPLGY